MPEWKASSCSTSSEGRAFRRRSGDARLRILPVGKARSSERANRSLRFGKSRRRNGRGRSPKTLSRRAHRRSARIARSPPSPAFHPLCLAPGPRPPSLAAAKAALRFFRGFEEGDLVLALVSGGTSSLLCLPRRGVTLAEKRRRIRRAMEEGWPIQPINRLRTTLSLVKGGRLADATRARVVTLVLSDVPEEDFRIVGSGPTVSSRKPRDRTWLLAGNRTGSKRPPVSPARADSPRGSSAFPFRARRPHRDGRSPRGFARAGRLGFSSRGERRRFGALRVGEPGGEARSSRSPPLRSSREARPGCSPAARTGSTAIR